MNGRIFLQVFGMRGYASPENSPIREICQRLKFVYMMEVRLAGGLIVVIRVLVCDLSGRRMLLAPLQVTLYDWHPWASASGRNNEVFRNLCRLRLSAYATRVLRSDGTTN
jgi:hypothetical protein